jgi:hypothetical protein
MQRAVEKLCYPYRMPPRAPTIADDLIDAVREDDFESFIAQARERHEAYDETELLGFASPPATGPRTHHLLH